MVAGLVGLWLFMSFYTVRPEEQSVELTFGECRGDCIGQPGLNFAPWPVVTREIVQVTGERTEEIGSGTLRGATEGLMLTGDENIVDITFQAVWNVRDPAEYLFNLVRPDRDDPGGRGTRRCARSSRARTSRRSSPATAA